jgi:RNA polymerase sigma-70 factor (sigma-E family)
MSTSRRWTHSTREDELLARLYERITEQQAARFAGRYDLAASGTRFRAWLEAQADERTPGLPVSRLESAAAGVRDPGGSDATDWGDWADRDADSAVTALYRMHYRALTRLAALLTEDLAVAEGIVQDSFVALHAAWPALRDGDQALAYLRRTLVSRCRPPGHRPATARNAALPGDPEPGADHPVGALLERSAVVAALRALPPRQREALILRYYSDLSESQIAAVMGISQSAVRAHTARAMSSLSAVIEKRRDDPAPPDPHRRKPAETRNPAAPGPARHPDNTGLGRCC